jgi:hypothetical protein
VATVEGVVVTVTEVGIDPISLNPFKCAVNSSAEA